VIAFGIALVAIAVVAVVALTVDAVGWKGAAAALGFGVAVAGLMVGGALLIEAGLKS
jgi:hypothetical protein